MSVGRDAEALPNHLGGAVEERWIRRLVRGYEADLGDAVRQGRVDHVQASHDVSLRELGRFPLAGVDMLEGGRVHHQLHTVHRDRHARRIAHITEKKSHARELSSDLVLFQFVPGKCPDLGWLEPITDVGEHNAPKGPGRSGDEPSFSS